MHVWSEVEINYLSYFISFSTTFLSSLPFLFHHFFLSFIKFEYHIYFVLLISHN